MNDEKTFYSINGAPLICFPYGKKISVSPFIASYTQKKFLMEKC